MVRRGRSCEVGAGGRGEGAARRTEGSGPRGVSARVAAVLRLALIVDRRSVRGLAGWQRFLRGLLMSPEGRRNVYDLGAQVIKIKKNHSLPEIILEGGVVERSDRRVIHPLGSSGQFGLGANSCDNKRSEKFLQ